MSAYLIANIDVHDPATFETYRQQVPPVIASFGGRYLVRGGEVLPVEGDPGLKRVVVLEFPSFEDPAASGQPRVRAGGAPARAKCHLPSGPGRRRSVVYLTAMNRLPAAFVILLAAWSLPAVAQEPPRPAPEAATGVVQKQVVQARRMMVVSADPPATEAGMAVLNAGGSAVDAAIAVQLMLNLVEPQSSGIGGGAFMLHWDGSERQLTTLDGRETAPAAADPDYFLKPDGTPVAFEEAVPGGRSVGVPGTWRSSASPTSCMAAALGRSFGPRHRLAEEGFPVSSRLASLIAGDAKGSSVPDRRRLFPRARWYAEGRRCSPPQPGFRRHPAPGRRGGHPQLLRG